MALSVQDYAPGSTLAPADSDREGQQARRVYERGGEHQQHEIDKFLLGKCDEDERRGASVMRPLLELFRAIDTVMALESLDSVMRDEVVLSYLRRCCESIINRLHGGLFPNEMILDFLASRTTPKESAEDMTDYIRDAYWQAGMTEMVRARMLPDLIMKGTMGSEMVWEEEVEDAVARDREMQPVLDPFRPVNEDGSPNLIWDMVESEERDAYLSYSRPAIKRIDPRQLIVPRFWGWQTLDELPWFGIRRTYTWEQLYLNRYHRQPVKIGDQQAMMQIGRFHNLPPRQYASDVPWHGDKDQRAATSAAGSTDARQETLEGFRAVEWWRRMDMEGWLQQAGGGGQSSSRFSKGSQASWLMNWRLQPRDLKPGSGWWRIVTLTGECQRVIEVSRTPYPRGDIPQRICDFLGRPNCAFGIGLVELLWPMQGLLNFVVSAMRDAVAAILRPPYVADIRSMDPRDGAAEDFEARLREGNGRIIAMKQGWQAKSGVPIMPVHPDVQSIDRAMQMIEMIRAAMLELGFQPPVVSGAPAGGDQTATFDTLLANAATVQEKGFLRKIEQRTFVEHHDQAWRLTQEMLVSPIDILALDPKTGDRIPKLIRPERLRMGPMRPRALGSTVLLEGPQQLQIIMLFLNQALQMLPPDAPVPVHVVQLIQDGLRILDSNVLFARIRKTDEEMVLEQRMRRLAQMQDAQMGRAPEARPGQMQPQSFPKMQNGAPMARPQVAGDAAANRMGGRLIQG